MAAYNRVRIKQLYRNLALKDTNPDGTTAEEIEAKDRLLEKELSRYYRRRR